LNLDGLAPCAAVSVVRQGLRLPLLWLLKPSWRALHTMWMPRPCTWDDMNAASTPYDPVLARRMGRMSVSAARRGRR
jgi:hypothetical protein